MTTFSALSRELDDRFRKKDILLDALNYYPANELQGMRLFVHLAKDSDGLIAPDSIPWFHAVVGQYVKDVSHSRAIQRNRVSDCTGYLIHGLMIVAGFAAAHFAMSSMGR